MQRRLERESRRVASCRPDLDVAHGTGGGLITFQIVAAGRVAACHFDGTLWT